MPGNSIPVMLLQGKPHERGRQHGAAFADGINDALQVLRRDRSPDAYASARERAARSWALARAQAPEVAAELTGVAAGAECDAIDLYLHVGFEFFAAPAPMGCSGIACAGQAGAVIGQNWDAPPDAAKDLALFIHVGDEGFEHAFVASVGTLGWVGCNRHGLAFTTNDLMLDMAPCGLPSQIVRRLLLAQRDVPSALRVLDNLPHMGGRCYLLGDASGAIAGVELSPKAGVRTMKPVSPILHTNHARLPETKASEDEAELQAVYPSSRERLGALEDVTGGTSTVADLMKVLGDRAGAPDAISKSLSTREVTETAFSIVFDCGRREFHLCTGRPSEGRYAAFRVSDYLGVPSIS